MSRLDPPAREDLSEREAHSQLVEAVMGIAPNSMVILARKKALIEAFSNALERKPVALGQEHLTDHGWIGKGHL